MANGADIMAEDLDLLDALLEEEGIARMSAIPMIPRRAEATRAPLSFQQERLWFLDQLEPASSAFNVSGAVRLRGRLDRSVLARAFSALVARHETLRTTFAEEDRRAVQMVAECGAMEWTEENAAGATDDAIGQKVRADTARAFDLRRGPLVRARLIVLAAEDHVLVVTIHHIVCDGWSIGVFLRELATLYGAFGRGEDDPLTVLSVQYADYAAWQRAALSATVLAEKLAWWRERLTGLAPLVLPLDRPRATVARPIVGDRVTLTVPQETRDAMRALAGTEETTLATVALAGFQALLARYAGQDDIAVGVANANRTPEVEGLIGFFTAMLTMRVDASGNPEFREFLRRVRTMTVEAYARADVPFEVLVEALKPERHANRHPLFQVSFVYQNLPYGDFTLPGLNVSRVGEDESARFDLEVFLDETPNGLRCNWVFDTALFDRTTVERMAGHYAVLLAGAMAEPETPLQALPLITAEERTALVAWQRARVRTFVAEPPLAQVFEASVAKFARRTALVFEGERLNYEALNRRANRLAHELRGRGVRPGALVGIFLERSIELVVGILGILKSGAAYVPVDPVYPAERIRFILEDSALPVLVTSGSLRARLGDLACEVVDVVQVACGAEENPIPVNTPNDPAYVIYTSGSTGKPKGCVVTHANVVRLMRGTEAWYGFDERDVWTLFHSCAFDFSVWELWGAFFYGGRLVVVPYLTSRQPEVFYGLLREQRVTVLNQTPSAFRALAQTDAEINEGAGLALRYVIFGGEALVLESLRPWFERHGDERPRLVNMYGITETTVHVTYRPITLRDLDQRLGSLIGEPIPDLMLHVLDHRREPVPVGVVGEIYVSGTGLANGYLRRDELTRQRFLDVGSAMGGRLYRTGDLARRRADGDVEYLGRVDQQVKLRGFRIELGEIETRLHANPLVSEAVVLLRNEVSGDARLVAWVVPNLEDAAAVATTWREEQTAQWQSTFDATYTEENPTSEEDFDIIGWNSSYTDEPLLAEEMRAWRDYTVAQLATLTLRRVLEIGCGTGMLLLALAPRTERYCGVDFSATVLARLGATVRRRGLAQVELRQARAHELGAMATETFDTVILNSVAQYFPDADYLLTVIEAAVARLADGGVLFIGDVRNLALLDVFHASVQFARADDALGREALAERVRRAVLHEEELVLAPEFFAQLPKRITRVVAVEIRLRSGAAVNELNAFRYDVVMRVGASGAEATEVAVLRTGTLASNVAESLARDFAVVRWLKGDGTARTVGEFRWREISTGIAVKVPLDEFFSCESDMTNRPLVGKALRALPRQLRDHLGATLPDYMVPSVFVVIDHVPLTDHGKIDQRALPAPDTERPAGARPAAAPRTPEEQAMAAVWAEVLGLREVGVEDNFFELGGHSLLATQLIARLRERLGLEVPLRALFEKPTVRALVASLATQPKRVAAANIARRTGSGAAPLSYAQRRLWFLEQLTPGLPAYHSPQGLLLAGRLDARALQAALDDIVLRHEVLRTALVENAEGEPEQWVRPAAAFALETVDLRGERPAERDAAQAVRIAALLARPFDLARGEVARGLLVRRTEDEAVLVIDLHHAVTDGWSLGVMVRELGEFYVARREGRAAVLPEPTLNYADYAAWQRATLAGAELAVLKAWWWAQLADAPLESTLPSDRPRVPRPATTGGCVQRRLPQVATERLTALAHGHGATPFMVLLTSWFSLLYRRTGQNDFVVGSPVAGREQAELEPLIGFFVNTLALRGRVRAAMSFGELLDQVRVTALDAYARQALPFEMLVEGLVQERYPGRPPLFQTMLVLQNVPTSELELEGVRIRSLALPEIAAKFDLSILAAETAEGIVMTAEFNPDLYDESSVVRDLEAYVQLLVAATERPECAIGELPVMSTLEHAAWMRASRGQARAWPRGLMHTAFEEQAVTRVDKVAVEMGEERLTYGELETRANRVANWLVRHGVAPERAVALCMERTPAAIVVMLGILKAGGVYVPLDPQQPTVRIGELVTDCAAVWVITDRRDLVEERRVMWTDLSKALAAESETRPTMRAQPENLAYVIYTSGSTGRPKGVMVPHAGAKNLAHTETRHYRTHARSRVLLVATLAFDASVSEILNALSNGATLVLATREELLPGTDFARLLGERRVTWATVRPSLLAATPATDLPALETLIVAGEILPASLAEMWQRPGRAVFNAYGPTECTVCATVFEVPRGSRECPIGRPLDNVCAYVLDAAFEPMPTGVPGELFLGGLGVTRGYLGQAGLTAERFLPDPFAEHAGARMYRTGDRVQRRADGTIEFIGRIDFQIKLRGFRIEPGEIEAALRAQPGVREAVVVKREELPGDVRLVAYVTGDGLDARWLRAALSAELPAHLVPAAIVTLAALPLNAQGKLDRRALPTPESGSAGGTIAGEAPRTPREGRVALVMERVLGHGPVGRTQDFFALGGHSFLALKFVAALEREFGQAVPVATVFTHPTPMAMASVLGDGDTVWVAAQAGLATLRAGDERPPLFLFHQAGGYVFSYFALARRLAAGRALYALQPRGLDDAVEPLNDVTTMAADYIGQIRRMQPRGPYRLAGHSLGGLLAFEVARQLEAAGECVAFLGLIDACLSAVDTAVEGDEVGALGFLAAQVEAFFGQSLGLSAVELAALASEARLERLAAGMASAGLAEAVPARKFLSGLLAVYRANVQAGANYRPMGPVAARTWVWATAELRAHFGGDGALNWAPWVRGGVEARELTGEHLTLLAEPHVLALAKSLGEALADVCD
jgi:amino acid adenylation domain-containing protein